MSTINYQLRNRCRPRGIPAAGEHQQSWSAAASNMQLLVALRLYGAGTLQVVTGDLVNASQPTVCRVVNRISRLLASTLFSDFVKFLAGAADFVAAMRDFSKIGNFPGVTGCIDCTQVRVKGPGCSNCEVNRNRKGYFSINVQVSLFLFSPLQKKKDNKSVPCEMWGCR